MNTRGVGKHEVNMDPQRWFNLVLHQTMEYLKDAEGKRLDEKTLVEYLMNQRQTYHGLLLSTIDLGNAFLRCDKDKLAVAPKFLSELIAKASVCAKLGERLPPDDPNNPIVLVGAVMTFVDAFRHAENETLVEGIEGPSSSVIDEFSSAIPHAGFPPIGDTFELIEKEMLPLLKRMVDARLGTKEPNITINVTIHNLAVTSEKVSEMVSTKR